jgi:hypothetical protein
LSMGQTRFNRGTRLPGPAHACHRAGHQAVTMLTTERAPVPVTAGRRRPRSVAALSSRMGTSGAPPFFLPSHAWAQQELLLLFSSLHTPLLTIAGHRCPSPSPFEQGIRSAVTSSSFSTSFKPELMAIASGPSTSLPIASSLVNSPLATAIRAPSTPPPLRGGTREPVVHLCPHLLRRRTSVRTATVTFSHLSPPPSQAYSDEPSFHPTPPSVPRGLGVPYGSTFPAVSPPAGRISPTQHSGRKGIGGPLLQLMGRKAMWAGLFCASWAMLHSDQAQLHSAFF